MIEQEIITAAASRRVNTVKRSLRRRAWWLIRRRVTFTLPELLVILTDGSEQDAKRNLHQYLQALMRCGILSIDSETEHSPRKRICLLRYRLEINNGVAAPIWQKARNEVFDPNTNVYYPLTGKEIDHA